MRHNVTVYFDDGNEIQTEINGTLESVINYYSIGRQFNTGSVEDKMAKVTKLVIHTK